LHLSAGAAAAVPVAVISGSTALAAGGAAGERFDGLDSVGDEAIMFCVHDARSGEVSILRGTSETVVRDRQLVARIMHAAGGRR